MNKLFSLSKVGRGVSEHAPSSASGSFISKYLVAHYQKIQHLEKDLKRVPEKEEYFFLQSDKQFNAFTFIPLLCSKFSIKHLYVATYSINQKVIAALVELHNEGLIEQITIIISDTLLSRNQAISDQLAAVASQYANINVMFAWVHAKVCLLETNDDHYVIEGSGNWSENAAYEQYIFANSKGLYDFRMKLFTETTIRHKVIYGNITKV